MKREIKFRAWDTTEGHEPEMHYFLLGEGFSGMNNCPIMQYTGLKDKDGKEIYEGDILELYDGLKWVVHDIRDNHSIESLLRTNEKETIEVIGNIHENPELLG